MEISNYLFEIVIWFFTITILIALWKYIIWG